MTLSDLRRLAIRKQIEIHFPIRNGMECVMTRHGLAQVPALRAVPDFNLEQELAGAAEFLIEPVAPAPPRRVSREELDKMLASGAAAGAAEHEEE